MLVAAGKYSDPRRVAAPGGANHAGGGRSVSGVPDRPPQLIIPKPGECCDIPEWYWKELRQGGLLQQIIAREKASMQQAIRRTATACRNFSQNRKSEFRRLASIPARLFFRWRAEDPHFWEDRQNLKSLKRDNDELAIWL